MLRDQTLAVIGAGNIGRALVGGLLRGNDLAAERIRATRRSAAALDDLRERLPGVLATTDNAVAVRGATVVIVSVKPQNAGAVLAEIAPHLAPDTLVLSTLAGVTTAALGEALGQDLPIVRAMPNTPALVDAAATAIAPGAHAEAHHLALARQIFQAVGIVEQVPEHLMDAVTGLSGSGPAYVFMLIEALTDAGVKQGMPRATALKLSAQTVLGAARLVLETGTHPAILRDEVTTPGGTTIAAVAELERHGLRTMLIDAVAIATERSRALSKLQDD
jgi:pyrroline-5-carboxylate reductase